MTTRKAHVVNYDESFRGSPENYVYRTGHCLPSIAPTTILAHDGKCRDAFPDAALDIWVESQPSSGVRRVSALWRALVRVRRNTRRQLCNREPGR
jgi:hypothetical protein